MAKSNVPSIQMFSGMPQKRGMTTKVHAATDKADAAPVRRVAKSLV